MLRRPDLFLAQLALKNIKIKRRKIIFRQQEKNLTGMWFVLDQLKFEIFDLMSSTLKQVSMTATTGDNKIETIKVGKTSKYNLDKYITDNKIIIDKTVKKKICYCRVSSRKQNNDLERQINLMQLNYPNYEIISDI